MLLTLKQKILAIGLLLTLLATAYTYFKEDSQVVEATSERDVVANFAEQDKYTLLNRKSIATHRPTESRRLFYTPMIDIFEVYIPPKVKAPIQNTPTESKPKVSKKPILSAPQVSIEPPPPPTAPALPFRYLGKLFGDDEYIVFLSLHGKSLSVKMGDVLQQTYRVDEIKPPIMQVTYLPLNIKQSFMIGEP